MWRCGYGVWPCLTSSRRVPIRGSGARSLARFGRGGSQANTEGKMPCAHRVRSHHVRSHHVEASVSFKERAAADGRCFIRFRILLKKHNVYSLLCCRRVGRQGGGEKSPTMPESSFPSRVSVTSIPLEPKQHNTTRATRRGRQPAGPKKQCPIRMDTSPGAVLKY